VSRESADTTTSVLQSVVDNGTATAAQAADRPAAGKTGTAEEDTAAWFAGYTPDLATVVSVMGQDPTTAAHKSLYGAMGLERVNGGGAPAEIWAQFTKSALKGTEASDFDLQLQDGAETVAPPSLQPSQPTTTGNQDNGGTTTTGGQGDQGQTQGQTNGGTTTTGGDTTTTGGTTGTTTDGTTTTGGTTTDGGTTTTGGTTGTTTDGGTTTTGGTTGTTTDGTTGGTTTGGTTAGPQSTGRKKE
jgi:membrane peptidoglycan carboxypeptidase